jgi:hypothetical protein
LLALAGVRENLEGLGDPAVADLGYSIAGIDIRVVLSRRPPVGPADLGGRRRALDP